MNTNKSPCLRSWELENFVHPVPMTRSFCSLATLTLYVLPFGASSWTSSGIWPPTLVANFFGMVCNKMRSLDLLNNKKVFPCNQMLHRASFILDNSSVKVRNIEHRMNAKGLVPCCQRRGNKLCKEEFFFSRKT